jgi:hypothetical protein
VLDRERMTRDAIYDTIKHLETPAPAAVTPGAGR